MAGSGAWIDSVGGQCGGDCYVNISSTSIIMSHFECRNYLLLL